MYAAAPRHSGLTFDNKMNSRSTTALVFAAAFLVAIPAGVHTLLGGPYVVDPEGCRRTFWIGPISTTVPFAALAVLFFTHLCILRSRSPASAYLGAIAAWLSMTGFTIFLTSQVPGPELSSTMGIAVMLTPFFYFPFLVVPYAIGSALGLIVKRIQHQGLSNMQLSRTGDRWGL